MHHNLFLGDSGWYCTGGECMQCVVYLYCAIGTTSRVSRKGSLRLIVFVLHRCMAMHALLMLGGSVLV